MKPRSLEKKATRRLTFLVTVPLIILAVWVTIFFYASIQNQSKTNNEEKTLLIASLLNNEVDLVVKKLETLSLILNNQSIEEDEIKENLNQFISNSHNITDVKVVDSTGRIIHWATTQKKQTDIAFSNKKLQSVLTSNSTTWYSPAEKDHRLCPEIFLAMPMDEKILLATLHFERLFKRIINFSVTLPITVCVHDHNGACITYSHENPSLNTEKVHGTQKLRETLTEKNSQARTIVLENDFLTGAMVDSTGWLVTLQQPKSIFWDKLRPLFAILALFFFGYIAIARFAIVKSADKSFDYFQRLATRIHNVANGQYEQDFPTEGYIELQNVKLDLYRMAQKIKEREEVILNLNAELEDKLDDALRAKEISKNAENEKAAQNQLLTTLLNNLQVGVVMVGIKTGKTLLSNKKAEELLGKPISKYLKRESFVEDYQIYKSDTDRLYPQNDLPIIRGFNGEFSYINDAKVVKANGSISHLEAFGCPVLDTKGRTIASLISFSDITERKIAQEKIQINHQLFLTILDGIDCTIYVSDMQTHKILFMNKYMKELFGGDLTGKSCYKVLKKNSRPCENCSNKWLVDENNCATEGHLWEGQHPITGRHNIYQERAIQWSDDRLVRIQVATDITQIREMEEKQKQYETRIQQAQKMEAICTLAGGIAHDFNNILSPLIGYTEIIREELKSDSRLLNYTNQILKAALRSKDLVQQILAFSRQSNQEKTAVEIQPIVKEALKLMRASIPSIIQIENKLDAKDGVINADPTQIHQIVMNLATNAYHAMEQTGGILTVTLQEVQIKEYDAKENRAPGRYIKLSVKDTGIGISEKLQQRIFDPYFTTKDPQRGTGLGLSVVQGIVESYDGTIKLQSKVGKGTKITIHFPAISKTSLSKKNKENEIAPKGSEHILLVDDEPAVAEMETKMLERLGYQVTAFTDSEKALKAFQKSAETYNLIITDMNMPNLNGAQLIRNVKEIKGDVPIIVCTGFSDNIDEAEQQSEQIDQYLMKPVLRNVMAQTIRKVITNKKAAE